MSSTNIGNSDAATIDEPSQSRVIEEADKFQLDEKIKENSNGKQ